MRRDKIKLLLVLSAIFILAFVSLSVAIDPPHIATPGSNVNCSNCHNAGLAYTYTTIDNTPWNEICWQCHDAGKSSKYSDTHSAISTGDDTTKRFWNGQWTNECRTCHDPHTQEQSRGYQANYSDGGAYLLYGTIVSSNCSWTGACNSISIGGTWIENEWQDYILHVPPKGALFRILSSTTDGTLTIDGKVYPAFFGTAGQPYAVSYGKLVRKDMSTGRAVINSAGEFYSGDTYRLVKFLNSSGPYSASMTGKDTENTTDAICVVCHTQTSHMNYGIAKYGSSFDDKPNYDHYYSDSDPCWKSGCHEPADKGFSAGCTNCHGYPPVSDATLLNSVAPRGLTYRGLDYANGAGKHYEHFTEQGFGCDYCHKGGGTSGQHNDEVNPTVQIGFNIFGAQGGVYQAPAFTNTTYTLAAGGATSYVESGSDRVCSNIYCHSTVQAGDGVGAPTYKTADWDGAAFADCNPCHEASPTTASHDEHLVDYTCNDCHSGNTHINNSIDVTIGDYTAGGAPRNGFGMCSNTSCHGISSPEWGGTLTCAECHASNGADHTSTNESAATHDTTHDPAGSSYITDCATCHGHNGSGGNHINGTVNFNATNLVTTEYNENSGNYSGSCTTSCHDSDASDWALGLRADRCVDCHRSSGSMGWAPTSGLHNITPTVSGSSGTHDEGLTGGCEACHTSSPSTAHIDGTQDTSAPTIVVSPTGGTFTDGTPPTCTASCHADAAGWNRKWSTTAANSDGTECANCHGDYAQGWVTGVVAKHSDAEVDPNHDGTDKCITCHTYDSGGTYYTWGTYHRNGNIELNDQLTWVDNGATVGCSNCHVANDGTGANGHEFTDTENTDSLGVDRWGRAFITGPSISCDGCHASNGRDHSDASENSTLHDTHNANGSYITDCSTCHAHNGPGTAGDGVHNDGTVDFDNSNISSTYSYSAANFGGTCGNNGCHDSEASEWAAGSLGADRCVDCHRSSGSMGWAPTSGLHNITPTVSGASGTHDEGLTGGCEACHTSAPSSSHYDGTQQNSAPTITVSPTGGTFTDGTPPTCTSTCHADAAGWNRKWSTTAANSDGTECANCHGDYAQGWVTGVVAKHSDAEVDPNHDGTDKCITCHTYDSGGTYYTWGTHHRNGNIELNDQLTWVDNGATVGCSNCHASNDGTGANGHEFTDTENTDSLGVDRWGRNFITGPSISCDGCHASNGRDHSDASENSTLHDTHNANSSYITDCSTCHAHNGPGTSGDGVHIDGTVDFDNSNISSTYSYSAANFGGTCGNNGCHDSEASEWAAGSLGADRCVDCHRSSGSMGWAPTSGLHNITPTISGSSGTHDEGLTGGCEACHTSAPSSAHYDGTQDTSAPTITVSPTGGTFTDGTPPTCTSTCHADNAAWNRKWSTTAANSDGTECANCHGNFAQGWVSGVGLRHQTTTSGDSDGDIEANHDGTDKCVTCHTYDSGGTYYTWSTQHNDGNIHINSKAGFSDNGSTVGCGACHSSSDGTSDEQHEFTDTTSRWTRVQQAGPEANCITCHSSAPGSATYVERNITGASGDFSQSSRHVFGVTPTIYDCVVCHREGNTDGTPNGGTGNGTHDTTSVTKTVSMRNVDSYNSGWEWNKKAQTATMHGDMDAFCLACHDSGGATQIAVNTAGNGVDTTTSGSVAKALTPFNDNLRGPTSPTGSISGTAAGFAERTRVIDVATQFGTGTYTWPADDGSMPSGFTGTNYNGNPSQHAVLGPRYNSNNTSWTAWKSVTLKSGQVLSNTGVKEKAQLHCADCHTVDTNAHGSARSAMLVDSGVTTYPSSGKATSQIDNSCYNCHDESAYDDNSKATGTRVEHGMCGHAFEDPYYSLFGTSYCFNCHAGAKSEDPYGWIHGMPSGADPDYSQIDNRWRFMGGLLGAWKSDISSWTVSSGTPTCYMRTSANAASACTRHQGKGSGAQGGINWGRQLNY